MKSLEKLLYFLKKKQRKLFFTFTLAIIVQLFLFWRLDEEHDPGGEHQCYQQTTTVCRLTQDGDHFGPTMKEV